MESMREGVRETKKPTFLFIHVLGETQEFSLPMCLKFLLFLLTGKSTQFKLLAEIIMIFI